MKKECINAASKAMGRELTEAEAKRIEDGIIEAQHSLARTDTDAYLAMTPAQRLTEAGKAAADNLRFESEKKQQRIALTILNHNKFQKYYSEQGGSMLDNIDRTLAAKLDGSDNIQSVETLSHVINNQTMRQLSDAIDQFGAKLFGLNKNDKAMIPVFQEMRGQATGIPDAKAFAGKLGDIFETLRIRYNAAGGKVGKLTDFGTPQSHSQHRVWKAGREGWMQVIDPLLDPKRYIKKDGSVMSEGERLDFLSHSWESIAYDGLLKHDGKAKKQGIRANRHAASRQLHFKSAEAYLEYHDQFSDQTLMSTLLSHAQGVANDIALVEKYGPNPDAQFTLWLTRAKQEAARAGMELSEINKKAFVAQNLFNEVSGVTAPIHNQQWARRANAFRQYLNTRLGSAVFSAMSDEATAAITAKLNNLSASKYFVNEMKQLSSPDAMRQARRMGLGLDTMLYAIDRYTVERITEGHTQRISSAVIRASGMAWMTDARKQAFGTVMMDGIHHLTKTNNKLSDLHPKDNQMLLSKGITETDWRIWKLAKPEEFQGNKLLSSKAILDIPDEQLKIRGLTLKDKQNAIDGLMGAILEETDVAIVTPGARERARSRGGTVKGTIQGELWLSALQFKAFPIAMITRHLHRAQGIGGKQGAGYLASIMASTTIMGALAVQLNELSAGRDPMDMTEKTFWMKAFAKGGGLGLYADFIFSTETKFGTSLLGSLEGPSIGMTEDILSVVVGDTITRAKGEETHSGAKLARLAKALTPGTSLWYTKAAMDHLIFQKLQEYASPGYLRRMEKRAERDFNQKYYYRPGATTPNRSPDLERAFGK